MRPSVLWVAVGGFLSACGASAVERPPPGPGLAQDEARPQQVPPSSPADDPSVAPETELWWRAEGEDRRIRICRDGAWYGDAGRVGEPPWKAEDRKGPPTRCDARDPYPIATMHWVPARPLLSLPWSLVVFGTVLSQSSDGSTEPGMKVHRVRADEVLLDRTAECAGAGDERDRCRGYCGESELSLEQAPLPSGSRIVIFGLAGGGLTSVLPFAIDETSRTSVQVAGPEDPFVDAVRVLVNTDNPRMAMASQRPVWTRFGEHDVDCFVHQIEWQQCTEVDMGELATRRCGAGSPADLWSA